MKRSDTGRSRATDSTSPYVKVVLFIAGWVCLFSVGFPQGNVSLQGIVRDAQTAAPMEGVNVRVAGKAAVTNAKGEFLIMGLPTGPATLVASFIGYTKTEKRLTITSEGMSVEIFLVSQSTELSSVTVVGDTDGQAEARKIMQNVVPVTVITARQIENRAGNLNEILARQAGVQIRWSGGLGSESRISVRGLEGRRVAIFIDGNPLNTPDGSLGINDLPVQIIERIEIYKGAVPAYLGGDGLGSAVNVVFRHREVSYIDASYSRQSFNTQIASLILKKTFDKRGIEAGVGVFDTQTDNRYTMKVLEHAIKVRRNHDNYHSLLLGGSVRFHRLWFDEVEIEGAFLKDDREIQGIQFDVRGVESRGKSGVAVLSLKKENFLGDKLGFRYNFISAWFNVKLVDTVKRSYNWDGSPRENLGQGELGTGPNLATNLQQDLRQRLNLDYRVNGKTTINLNNTSRYATLDPDDPLGNEYAGANIFNYPASLTNSITGLTVEKKFRQERVLMSAAIKHYYNFIDGYNTSIYQNNDIPDKLTSTTAAWGYNFGIRYTITGPLLVKASHEKGVRLPGNSELFGDGVLITPAMNLKPEIAHNNSVGLYYDRINAAGGRLQVEANGFMMDVEDLIQLSGNGLTLGYVNYAQARIAGVDFDVKYDITRTVYSSVNGTFQNLKDKNRFIPGTQDVRNPTYNLNIPNTPRLFFNWNVEWHTLNLLGQRSKTRIIYDGSFVDTFNYGFAISIYDEKVIPSYHTHTLSFEQSFNDGRYIITGEVNNLTGEVVINNYNQPLPGRSFRIKVRYLLFGKESQQHH